MSTTFDVARDATGRVRPGHDHGCKPVEIVPGLWTAHFHDIEDIDQLRKACGPKVHLPVYKHIHMHMHGHLLGRMSRRNMASMLNSAPENCPGFYASVRVA